MMTQSIKITGSTGLTKEEIAKMKEDAEKNADHDREEKEKIEARNKAEHMIYVSEKSLKDVGDKAPQADKEAVESKIKELKESLEKGTREDIEQKTSALSEVLQKIGQHMYGGQGQPGQQPDPNAASGSGQPAGDSANSDTSAKDKKDVEEGEVVS
jgi:molecular chaperone DnaK